MFHVGMTVTTDKSAYAVAEDITASWSNLPGNAHDWIALAYQGSAAASYVRWTYTNGATTGSYSFQGLSAGTYVARAFLDDGTAIATESAPFQVGATPTVATDKTAYTTAETAQVTFANAPSTMDWIAIAADGSPLSSYVTWQSTGGGAGGTVGLSLAGLSTGTYVARLFTNNTYDLVASSATFAVSAGASTTTVTSDAATYNAGDTVTIHYAGMTGSTSDWIGISAPAAPAGQYIQWAYVNAMTSGSQPFYNLPPGTYVARAYFNNGSVVQAESGQFTVQGSTTCTTDKTTYANGETVTVSYTGMLGHALDWVSLSAPGSPEGSYVYWTFTGGGVAGSKAFANVAPGTYVARCYFQSENTVRASSPQITVNTPSSTDSDGDGMPDDWEVAHGLSPLVPDAFDDLDGDGFPNVFEYAAGSDPNDRNSTPTPTFVVHGAGGGTHTTVSAAIAAANAGTNNYPIIGIAPGTYAGSGNVGLSISSSKKLLILGLEGAAKTIFDGGGTSTGWVVNAAVIASVTFQRMSSWALWVSVSSGELRLVDLLMKDNVSTSYAAGVHVYSASKLSIVGSTFINNTGNASYEQIYLGSGAATIQNTVVWGASSNPMLLKAGSASLSANYCLIKGQMLSGTGNLAGTTDPKLRADGRLPWDSPLRGAGGSVGQSRLDMDGELRPTTGPDIGVDQFEDVDGDGLADVWELSSLGDLTTLTSRTQDFDGDGLTNEQEYQSGTLPNVTDTDGDGLSDGDEVAIYNTNPLSTDTDGDGMPDAWEIAHGLSPLIANALDDADGDRFPNVFEYIYGTDPSDRQSVPTPTLVVDGTGGGTHATVSGAIDAANAASSTHVIIGVAPGTYAGTGNVNLPISSTKKLLVIGLEGASKTIIDGGKGGPDPGFSGWSISSTMVISSLTFQRMANWAVSTAGSSTEIRLVDVLMKDNASTSYGAAVHAQAAKLGIVGSTFLNNTGPASFGQIYVGGGSATIQNTVVWDASSSPALVKASATTLTTSYCLVRGQALPGTGNLAGTTNPQLRSDGRLRTSSPLRAAGGSVAASRVDMDGELRPSFAPDIGVDQFNDSDDDGLPDAWEIATAGDLTTISGLADADSDGLNAMGEYDAESDWLDPDTDHDGVNDGLEVAHGLNPRVSDADDLSTDLNQDGLVDAIGLQLNYSPSQLDDDNDSVSNADEALACTSPLRADTDGDGVPDNEDAFPLDPRMSALPSDPEDVTAPIITLTAPWYAVEL